MKGVVALTLLTALGGYVKGEDGRMYFCWGVRLKLGEAVEFTWHDDGCGRRIKELTR